MNIDLFFNRLILRGHALHNIALAGILMFAFWAGMAPHWDYPYPLHVDEWFHLGYGQEIMNTGGLSFESPYENRIISYHPEMGFHMIWAFLGLITGLPLLDLFRLAPGVLMVLLAFFTYLYGRHRGFGLEAALFIPLIPTSLWTLGPAFVVPVSIASLAIPLIILPTGERLSKGSGPWLWTIMVLLGGTLFVHPTTESLLTLIATLYIGSFMVEMVIRRRYREAAKLLIALALRVSLPAIVLAIWIPSTVLSVFYYSSSRIVIPNTPIGLFHQFLQAFGLEAAVIGVIGIGFYIYRSGFLLMAMVLPFVIVFLGVFVEFYPKYHIGPPPLYNRSWIMLGILLCIFLGCAVSSYFRLIPVILQNIKRVLDKKFEKVIWGLLGGAGVGLVGFILLTGLFVNNQRKVFADYYHLIDFTVAHHYKWIGERVPQGERLASGAPVMGWAYPLLGGIGSRSFGADALPFADSRAETLRSMMYSANVNVPWLREHNISVFYSCDFIGRCRELSTPGIFKVKEGVYIIPQSSEE